MGLTRKSIGISAVSEDLIIKKRSSSDKVIALAGNPNVGKSTIFNGLTGLNQHTGNWPGKTVANAQGYCSGEKYNYVFVDIPGTYSLFAHSAEEEVARNFLCFSNPDAVVVVCDATCIERNLNLVLQSLEICDNVIVCLNLMDEAKRKGIFVDKSELEKTLGVPVVTTVARNKKSLKSLLDSLENLLEEEESSAYKLKYPEPIENAIYIIERRLSQMPIKSINSRWLSLRLLDNDKSFKEQIKEYFGSDLLEDKELKEAISLAKISLRNANIDSSNLKEIIVTTIFSVAQSIAKEAVKFSKNEFNKIDRKIDNILTSRLLGFPLMLLMFAAIFWLTIVGANYPSQMLSGAFAHLENHLRTFLVYISTPEIIISVLIDGVYRVLTWVVAVMLPPMAIFFPLFTLLEDLGYLPRIAYNLDKPFKKCNACGKQALTMCMGFGCNAAGVVGCRIIDSPRERMLAILTNAFVPCNGRFPTLITIITIFFIGAATGAFSSVYSALLLTLIILLGIFATFGVTYLLSKTLLKGLPSSFALELPPYRKPQIGKVIVRSVLDRTLFTLGRAAAVAAPAGLVIWLLANITVNDVTILKHCCNFLEPFATLIGLDGVILMAFILGFPANEIVIPIAVMAYISNGQLVEYESLFELGEILRANGWTFKTAICTVVFSLMHWPCSTTVLTIKKETGSFKWTALAVLIPTLCGVILCAIINLLFNIFS